MAIIYGRSSYDNFVGDRSSDEYRMSVNFGVTDMVDGGTGTDTLSYFNAARAVHVVMADAGQLGSTFADITMQFTNPATGRTYQSVQTETVTRFKGIENVTGCSYDDTITGNSAANRIDGHFGHDALNGGGGNDTIVGGGGSDELRGGSGADTFLYSSFLESSSSPVLTSQITSSTQFEPSFGEDDIFEFELGIDKIDLSAIDANSTISGNQAFDLLDWEQEFSGTAGELMVRDVYTPTTAAGPGQRTTLIQGDIDGDGHYDFRINAYVGGTIDNMTGVDLVL